MDGQNCYGILGLPEGASLTEVKAAYRRLALRYHPDKGISRQDGEKFKMIAEAYRTIRSGSHKASSQSCRDANMQDYRVKTSKWSNLGLEKLFEELGCYSRIAKTACTGIYRCERGLLRNCGRAVIFASSKVPKSSLARHARSLTSRTVRICNPIMGKNLQSVRSKIGRSL
ncbi:MAG TPA: DnaJ domain-containing protein [Candidatus Nitrosotalea sp.]|nr:DnaJ domain-containing protein [Candidatus Nitrosotalea sp.]